MNHKTQQSAFYFVFTTFTVLLFTLGCDGSEAATPDNSGQDTRRSDAGQKAADEHDPRLVVTADWLNKSLSLLDLDTLLAGVSSREEALIESIDLSAYSPGPLEVQITPDKKTALVTVSAGFFSIPLSNLLVGESQAIPDDPGKLLFIDLDSRQVVAEIDTGHGPMGIAITPDGSRAFIPHFSDPHVAVIDVVARELLRRVEVGPMSEEIALDDTGSVGIFSYSATGNFRTFAASDMAGTLSPDVSAPGDAAGVTFFPGTKTAFVVQAPNVITGDVSGYDIVDVREPQAPVVLDQVRFDSESVIQYPAVAVPGRGTVIVPVVGAGKLSLREYGLSDGAATVQRSIDIMSVTALFGAFSLAVVNQKYVLCALPGERALSITDLESELSVTVPWGQKAGPTGVAIR